MSMSTAQTPMTSSSTQPPSQTANPPAVSRPRGTPCNMRAAGLSAKIENRSALTPFGYVRLKLATSSSM